MRMINPTRKATRRPPADLPMPAWFIFTSTGMCFTIEGDAISQAVAAWKRVNVRGKGEIVGVIRGAAEMPYFGRPHQTHVFGVVCCIKEIDAGGQKQPEGYLGMPRTPIGHPERP